MAKRVVWTIAASRQLNAMALYLEEEVSLQSAQRLVKRVMEKVDILRYYPEIGRPSKRKKTVRGISIDKHRKLYYRIHGRQLIIVFLFDSRQQPEKNPY